jgi:hypothetical protein
MFSIVIGKDRGGASKVCDELFAAAAAAAAATPEPTVPGAAAAAAAPVLLVAAADEGTLNRYRASLIDTPEHPPDAVYHVGLCEQSLSRILDAHAADVRRSLQFHSGGGAPRGVVVLDACFGDAGRRPQKSEVVRRLIYNRRASHLDVVLSMSPRTAHQLTHQVWNDTDFVFVMEDALDDARMILVNHFVAPEVVDAAVLARVHALAVEGRHGHERHERQECLVVDAGRETAKFFGNHGAFRARG